MHAMKTKSERLKEAVLAAGYNGPADFADALGIAEDRRSTIRSHMNGTRNFRENSAKLYAAKLNVSWMWLLYGHGDKSDTVPESSAVGISSPPNGSDAYDAAARMVREVFAAAEISDKELETKAIAKLYHAMKSGQ